MPIRPKTSITDVLTTSAPPISPEDAEQIARRHFGVSGIACRLTSERDQNFHVRAEHGKQYVLKITNPAEDPQVTDFQTRALLHIAVVDPELPVQHVQPTLAGKAEYVLLAKNGLSRVVRLLSFLEGEPLHKVQRSSAQRRDLGRSLARLGLALRGFFHPAAGHELLWDIKHASRLRALLAHIPDERRRALAGRFLDGFEEHALPVLHRLRAQVIHNDFQPYNVLVDAADHDRVSGIIDFGDMVHAPLIDDLAVACAYQLSDMAQPLDTAGELVAAYHSVLPLEPVEVDLLFDLIATRLVMTVAITGWRAMQYPENREYILRNNPRSWTGLEHLALLSRADAQRYLHDVCSHTE